jgi:RES domain-containing protein
MTAPHGPGREKRYFLEVGSVQQLTESKRDVEKHLNFYWRSYSDLAFQRAQIIPTLLNALREIAVPNFVFSDWQRAVSPKYLRDPLSAAGSLKLIGGRFNIGEIDTGRYPPFPALYLASDKTTAIQEKYQMKDQKGQPMSASELALTNPESLAVLRVNGLLSSVIDLRKSSNSLKPFVSLIKDFKISPAIVSEAKHLNITPPSIIREAPELMNALLWSEWRQLPMLWDVPAPSQIFGQLIEKADIEAVVYPSSLASGDCIALFYQNFKNSDSFAEIPRGELPEGVRNRIDSASFQ